MFGSGLTAPTLAERQAAIDAAQGGANAYGGSALITPVPTQPVIPAGMMPEPQLTARTLEERQAAINAAGGGATYGGQNLQQIPVAQRQQQINTAQGGPNVYSGQLQHQIPLAWRQQQINQAQGGPNPNPGHPFGMRPQGPVAPQGFNFAMIPQLGRLFSRLF